MPASLVAAGKAALVAPGKALLLGAPPVIPSPGAATAPALSTVPGLASWFDAGVEPAQGWFQTLYSLPDKAGNSTPSSMGNSNSGGAYCMPHLAGLLGGLTYLGGASNYTIQNPFIDPGFVFGSTVQAAGDGSLSIYFVWSRPNQIQDGQNPTTATATLLKIGAVTVLSVTGRGDGTDQLVLFPATAAQTVGVLSLRHTHSVRICISPTGVDVWLDNTRTVVGAANPLALSGATALAFLPSAQCILHEVGIWPKALTTSDHAALSLCTARWPLGARYAANGILFGQSNAGNIVSNNILTTRTPFLYWTDALAANLLSSAGSGTSLYSGRGIYGGPGDTSNLLTNAGDGAPAGWVYGNGGSLFQQMVAALTPDLLAGVAYIAWYWSETDSARSYSEKAIFEAAVRRCWQLIRATLGQSAANLPILVISALPFSGTDGGCQMLREVMADLTADPSLNASYLLTQTADAIGAGDTWNATTGIETGPGNGAHRDDTGNANFIRRMALPIGQAVLKAAASRGRSTELQAMPAGLTDAPGPSVASAHYEGTAVASTGSILVTIQHANGATDLAVPLQAAVGAGWTVMDGGTPAAPGALIKATACARVSATTLRITLANTLSNPGSALLYYPYGTALNAQTYATIGQGDAVTDNFSTVVLPSGWTAGTDIGAVYQPNYPLKAPAYGVALS